jgi:hypothetical protein
VKIKTNPIYEIHGHFINVPLYVHGYHFRISISITNKGPARFNGGRLFVNVLFAFGEFGEKIEANVEPIDVGQTLEINLNGHDKWGVLAQGHALFLAELGEKASTTTQSVLIPHNGKAGQTYNIKYKSIPICDKDSRVLDRQEKGYQVLSFYSLSRGESYTLIALYLSIFSIFILNYDKIVGLLKLLGLIQ